MVCHCGNSHRNITHNTSESEMVATLQQSTNKISSYLWLTSHFKLSLIEDDNHIKSSSQLPFSTFKKLLAKFHFLPAHSLLVSV